MPVDEPAVMVRVETAGGVTRSGCITHECSDGSPSTTILTWRLLPDKRSTFTDTVADSPGYISMLEGATVMLKSKPPDGWLGGVLGDGVDGGCV